MRIYFKEGVIFNGASSFLFEGLGRVAPAFAQYGQCTVTSILDGAHKSGSLHYLGRAADLRSHHIPRQRIDEFTRLLRNILGPDWDILLEKFNQEQEHFHVEFDPKGPRRVLVTEET